MGTQESEERMSGFAKADALHNASTLPPCPLPPPASLPDHPTQTDYWANQAATNTKKQMQNALFRLSEELPFGLRV